MRYLAVTRQSLSPMRRLAHAPNLLLAQLWADWLCQAGVEATVQRVFASGIAGEIPPDQALPEVWITDEAQFDRADALLAALRQAPRRQWRCAGCGEAIDGGFEQCWQCGAMMPR